jgi:hypothetical protein
MASLVAATPGPPQGPVPSAPGLAPDPNAGRTWRLIPDPGNQQGFLLLEGRFNADGSFAESSRFVIGTNLPSLADCQDERIGDMVKDMVGAGTALETSILRDVILPAYGGQPRRPTSTAYYNFLMANKEASQNQLKPYITEGIFARSSVTRKGICDVVIVVPESGDKGAPFSTRYDPSNPGSVRYLNTGAIPMDPSSSNAGNTPIVWPLPFETVYYGSDCLYRFGLPNGLTWQAKTLGVNEFEYTIDPQPIGNPAPPRPFLSNSIPSIITEGNRERMRKFARDFLQSNGAFIPAGIPEALQSTIYKEEGDLMQILEYLCFYHAGYIYTFANPDPFDTLAEGSRKKSVMVTTDEVVFKICCDLGIPCIYTGGKSVDPDTGIHISGYGAYKFYNPVIDPSTAFKNTIMNIFNNKKGINDIQIQLLRDITWSMAVPNKNIYYYKQGGRTNGMRVCFRPSGQDRIGRYNQRIQGLIDLIAGLNAQLDGLKDTALAGIDGVMADDAMSADVKASTIAGIIDGFNTDSVPFLTKLYIEKTKASTSVDTDVISVVYNCIDVPLCAELTTGFVGGSKLTGGDFFDEEEWIILQSEFNNVNPYNSLEPYEFEIRLDDITNSEYNVLLIIFLGLRGVIKNKFSTKIGDQDVAKNRYATFIANSICISIYTRYAYLVSLINNLPSISKPDHDYILNIKQLCDFESLEIAIEETLDLIGINILERPPHYITQLYASNYILDGNGYIRGVVNGDGSIVVTPGEIGATILNSLIFSAPHESYNAPGERRFDLGAAAAMAPEMQSQYPAKAALPLYRQVSDSYLPLAPPPPGAWPVKLKMLPPTLGRTVSDGPQDKQVRHSRKSLKYQSTHLDPELEAKLKIQQIRDNQRSRTNAHRDKRMSASSMSASSFGGKKRTKKNKRSKKIKKSKSRKNKTKRKTI